jgi:hypothetical protein
MTALNADADSTGQPEIRTEEPAAQTAIGPLAGKAAGYVVLVFAAIGVYLFFDSASMATGGKSLPLGKPLLHS